jgi:hypothetical protein
MRGCEDARMRGFEDVKDVEDVKRMSTLGLSAQPKGR